LAQPRGLVSSEWQPCPSPCPTAPPAARRGRTRARLPAGCRTNLRARPALLVPASKRLPPIPKHCPACRMKCYRPDQLPVLNALASEFAVCDNWHASIPGPTWPNRMFVHAASSGGLDRRPSPVSIETRFRRKFKFLVPCVAPRGIGLLLTSGLFGKRQTESGRGPALVDAPKGSKPADAAGSRHRKKPCFIGVFQVSWQPVNRLTVSATAYLARQVFRGKSPIG